MKGQEYISNSTVVIIGIGALGCVSADNLARAGVGKLILVDRDVVELDNLQRQVLFTEDDVGLPKVIAAQNHLERVNSDIIIESVLKDVNFSNVEMMIRGADLVVDGTDNLETRFLINDACVKNNVPWIYGGAIGTMGMTKVIIPRKNACFRCFIDRMPPAGSLGTCDTVGVLNSVTGIIGSLQSAYAIRMIVENDLSDEGLVLVDVWRAEIQRIRIPMNPECKCCGKGNFEFLNDRRGTMVTSLCGKETVQITPVEKGEINIKDLRSRLEKLGRVEHNSFFLTFYSDPYEITIFTDGRATIKGTTDKELARSLYAKYVGT